MKVKAALTQMEIVVIAIPVSRRGRAFLVTAFDLMLSSQRSFPRAPSTAPEFIPCTASPSFRFTTTPMSFKRLAFPRFFVLSFRLQPP